jgi:Zn-dependent M28 family amino/carboxypeptidase
VHFLGYGIKDTAYNDYKSIVIEENGIGIMLSGEPIDKHGQYFISGNQKPSSKAGNSIKIKEASSQGLGCLFIIVPDIEQSINRYKSHYLKPTLSLLEGPNKKNSINCFYISYDMADEILGLSKNNTTISKLEKKITAKKSPQSQTFSLNTKIELISDRKHEIVTSENVMGFIEGGDKKEEIIILTAHYDHLGIKDNIVYNGADDDGSGTVALLELAEAFAKAKVMGYGPRRSILFMPVSGEEKGLLGSRYYTENPVFPLENTVANLNIDMIGRIDTNYKDDPNYVYIIGADRLSQELHYINETANSTYTEIKLDYRFNHADDPNRFYYRSDHYNFAKNNIPIIFYFTGVHEDYHKPTDTIDKIDFNKMENIARLIYFTAWELANRDERIKLDKKNN